MPAAKQKIHAAIIQIMREVGAIAKEEKNESEGFSFRGVDTVYNRCHPLFAKAGVYQTSEVMEHDHHRSEISAGGATKHLYHAVLRIRYTFFAEDGSSVSTDAIGEGQDYAGDKASNKAMSMASKYALLQLLQIPTAMIDSDRDTPVKKAESVPRGKKTRTVATRADRVSSRDVKTLLKTWQVAQKERGIEPTEKAWSEMVAKVSSKKFNALRSGEWSKEAYDTVNKAVWAIHNEVFA